MISEGYRALLQKHHASGGWGPKKNFRHIDEVRDLMNKVKGQSVWDFGSGTESFRNAVEELGGLGWKVHQYDPGTGRADMPTSADLVLSCDVLEHVEPEFIMDTLDTLFRVANKALYLVIACRQAKARLVDGSPAHLLVHSPEWWLHVLGEFARPKWRVERIWAVAGKELRISYVAA